MFSCRWLRKQTNYNLLVKYRVTSFAQRYEYFHTLTAHYDLLKLRIDPINVFLKVRRSAGADDVIIFDSARAAGAARAARAAREMRMSSSAVNPIQDWNSNNVCNSARYAPAAVQRQRARQLVDF